MQKAPPRVGLRHVAYSVLGPIGSRFERVGMRLVAFPVKAHPDPSQWKVLLQVMEGGKALVEHPVHVEWMTPFDLVVAISQSIRDGWDITPAPEVSHAN